MLTKSDNFRQGRCSALPSTRFPYEYLHSDLTPSPPLKTLLRPLSAAFAHLRLATISTSQRGDSALAMNSSGVTSPPSIRVHDMNSMNGLRSPSTRTAGRPFSRSPGPVAVPGARGDDQFAPPPLPPPRYIEDLAAGSDPGWKWGNTPNHGGFGGGILGNPRSPSSSLRGSRDQRMEDEGLPERPDYSRHGSSNATIKSSAGFDRTYDFSRNVDEGYHSLSGSSLSNHRSVDIGVFAPSFSFIHHALCATLQTGAAERLESHFHNSCHPIKHSSVNC